MSATPDEKDIAKARELHTALGLEGFESDMPIILWALADVRAEEREACAKICEENFDGVRGEERHAMLIRARSKP